jgi:3-hydroxy-9,10-secoandrosta-1,3,5(10)-triene-9,17-dione monooxygenase
MLTPTIPTAAELIGRARDLAPVIARRALECERLGRLPDESFADFRDAGFYRILQPKRFGGYEHDMYTLLEVTREIGRSGCCSSAWVLAILAIHNFYLGYFPPRAQEDIWGEDQDTQTCTPFVPAGKITKVAGGIEIRDGR